MSTVYKRLTPLALSYTSAYALRRWLSIVPLSRKLAYCVSPLRALSPVSATVPPLLLTTSISSCPPVTLKPSTIPLTWSPSRY